MTKKKFIASLLFIFAFAAFFEISHALAEESIKGFSVNPFFQDITLTDNQTETSFSVEIANNTGELAVFKLSVVDFGTLDETGGVAFLGEAKNLTDKYALASWISLEKDGLVLASGEKQAIKVTIQNRESLSPGGHYAAIMAKLDTSGAGPEGSGQTQVALEQSVSSLIFARKVGGEVYGLTLKDKEIKGSFFSLPKAVRLRFQNTGNVHLMPRGVAALVDPMGRVVARGTINQESARILPETFRVLPVTLRPNKLALIPGKYKIFVDYRFDGKETFASQQVSIFLIPTAFVLALLVGVGIFAIIARIIIKKKNANLGK